MFSKLTGLPAKDNVQLGVFLLDVILLLMALVLDNIGLLIASLVMSVATIVYLKIIVERAECRMKKY